MTKPSNVDDAPAVWVHPDELVPWAKNPKPIEPKDVREMRRSIRRFGFGAPIVARLANREIIEGHLRHETARRMKLERVPVRFLDLSEEEAHMLAIAAIKFEHRRETNDDQLAEVLDELESKGVDLEDGTGFEDGEIDKILVALHPDGDAGQASGRKKKAAAGGRALTYRIVIDCTDEEHQASLLERMELDGLKCKPLIS